MININSLYGNEKTYLNIPEYGVKWATFSDKIKQKYLNHSIGGARFVGLLTGETPDTSVCPIAVDKNSSLVNIQLVNRQHEILVPDTQQSPLMFHSTFQGYTSDTMYNEYVVLSKETTTERSNYPWNVDSTIKIYDNNNFPNQISNTTVPIVEFEYKKIIFLLCVEVADASYSNEGPNGVSRKTFDLEAYIKNEWYTRYPFIISVFLVPYYNTGTTFFPFEDTNNDSIIIRATDKEPEITQFSVLPMYGNNVTYNNEDYNILYRYLNTGRYEITTASTYYYISGSKTVIGGIAPELHSQYMWTDDKKFVVSCGADMFKIKNVNGYYNQIYSECVPDNYLDFEKWCLKQTAYLGMFFTTSRDSLQDYYTDAFWDLPTTYLGIIDENGVTHGQYTNGKENRKQDQFNWDSLKNQSPYDYTKVPDTNTYNTTTKLNPNPFNTGFGKFTKSYIMQGTEVFLVSQFLYNTIASNIDNEDTNYLYRRFLTSNPIDCITSLTVFPFDLAKILEVSTLEQIILGNQPVTYTLSNGTVYNVTGFPVTQATAIIDCGTCTYYRYFKDFRDYEPFSNAEISIPYCGSIPISPSEYMGHTISVKMIVDFSTGGCLALVYRDEMVMDSITGTIGAQVSVSGIAQADYQNAIYQANTNLKRAQLGTISQFATAAIGGAAAISSGNIAGAFGSITSGILGMSSNSINLEQAQYELTHVQTPYKTLGTSTPITSMCNEQAVRLIIKRPKMLSTYNPFEYGHTVGFACLITTTLSNITGYTKISNIDMSGIAATSTEKQMILDLLQSGIIL